MSEPDLAADTTIGLPPPIRLRYFLNVTNIGDRMSPTIVGAISGRQARWYRKKTKPHLLALGSLMSAARPTTYVWGAGVMHPDIGIGNALPQNILALRGKLSHDLIRRHFGRLPDIPLGDPGFLVSRVLPKFKVAPVHQLGVAAHYVDADHATVVALCSRPGVILLDPRDATDIYFERLAACRAIVGSSLHGLIFAEALGIPNLWMEVAGSEERADFKYRDWFSLAQQPQAMPVRIVGSESTEQLTARCQLHEMSIDEPALRNALTPDAVAACSDNADQPAPIPALQCRRQPVPIFVISYNRPRALRRAIGSYRQLSRPIDIIVHDNGSTDTQTLDVLAELERSGAAVYRRGRISSPEELNRVAETVEHYFRRWSEPARYVVTDCDIDLCISAPNILDVLNHFLDRFPAIGCAGPMLRIRDVPKSYRLYNHMMNLHVGQFWSRSPELIRTPWGQAAFQPAIIDSTFAMFRAGSTFRRKRSGVRLYEPYEAKHLDWYGSDDAAYGVTSSPLISHWGNDQLTEHEQVELQYSEFNIVRRRDDGSLEVIVEKISGAN